MINLTQVVAALVMATCTVVSADTNIPFPAPTGDRGKYAIIEISRDGLITFTTHRRDGPSGVSFTKSEINCAAGQYRVIGEVDDDIKRMKRRPGKWTDVAPGSSKHKLFMKACTQQL